MSDPAYAREELISICEDAIRPEAVWHNRDSEAAHRQLGECWALLKAGCEFEVDLTFHRAGNDQTIWVCTTSKGFQWFEIHEMRDGHFYLPTRKRLAERGDEDWY